MLLDEKFSARCSAGEIRNLLFLPGVEMKGPAALPRHGQGSPAEHYTWKSCAM